MVFASRSNRPLRFLLTGALVIGGCRQVPTEPARMQTPPVHRPAEAWPGGFVPSDSDAPAAPPSEAVPADVLPVAPPVEPHSLQPVEEILPSVPVEEHVPVGAVEESLFSLPEVAAPPSQVLSESARLPELARPFQGELVAQPPGPESGVRDGDDNNAHTTRKQGELFQFGPPPAPSGLAVASPHDVSGQPGPGRQLIEEHPPVEGLRDGIEVFLVTPQDQGELLTKPRQGEELNQGTHLPRGGRHQLELPLVEKLRAEESESLSTAARLERGQDAGQGQQVLPSTVPPAPQVQQGSMLAWSPQPAHRPDDGPQIPLENLLPSRWEPTPVLSLPLAGQGLAFSPAGQGFLVHGSEILTFTAEGRTQVWSRLREPAGHLILADGTHILCDSREQAVLQLDARGRLKARLAEEYRGTSLHRPTGIISDGGTGFYFTDPGFPESKSPVGQLFHLSPDGDLTLLCDQLDQPVGLTLSTDGKALLVTESGSGRLLEFSIESPARLGQPSVLARLNDLLPGSGAIQAAEIVTDSHDRIFIACPDRELILILNRQGGLLRQISTAPLQPRSLRLNPGETRLYAAGAMPGRNGGAVYGWNLQEQTP